ncbi:MAG: hypothetical protein DWQ34_01595 [Planctomycetota bacterium]|nr:MAG: hypothetical protein DWQ34_01595 [Planctomycetota bacterium]REK25397.1 MAG: hypothetical protein DWQ41_12215 [Planctomycetota bacterium]REK35719.1 MAG: hypothetical protein DWQ45_11270 [Planctomycetota bacterium]
MNTTQHSFSPRIAILVAIMAYGAFCKLIPYILMQFGVSIDPTTTTYPWNFSPVPALCLFCGAFFRDIRWAFAVPLAAWFAGDLGILALVSRQYGFSEGLTMAFYPNQIIVYAGFALIVGVGVLLPKVVGWLKSIDSESTKFGHLAYWTGVIGSGVFASVLFFALTNFGVWITGGGMMYPLTWAGLVECYTLAIPFFRNFALATAGFSVVLFSPIGIQFLDESEDRQPAYELA